MISIHHILVIHQWTSVENILSAEEKQKCLRNESKSTRGLKLYIYKDSWRSLLEE